MIQRRVVWGLWLLVWPGGSGSGLAAPGAAVVVSTTGPGCLCARAAGQVFATRGKVRLNRPRPSGVPRTIARTSGAPASGGEEVIPAGTLISFRRTVAVRAFATAGARWPDDTVNRSCQRRGKDNRAATLIWSKTDSIETVLIQVGGAEHILLRSSIERIAKTVFSRRGPPPVSRTRPMILSARLSSGAERRRPWRSRTPHRAGSCP